MLRINELRLPIEHDEADLKKKITKILRTDKYEYSILRRSLDARKKPDLFYSYVINIKVNNETKILRNADKKVISIDEKEYFFPNSVSDIEEEKRPVVIGLGPAGLFAAYYLAKFGFRPIVFERGEAITKRTDTVKRFWQEGVLNPDSNAQFGEGGAGAFSDGKLNTLIKDKYGRNRAVLRDLVEFGAPEEILFDHKPHVGTDKLVEVVGNISDAIRSYGGEIYYNTKIDDFDIQNGKLIAIGSKANNIRLENHPVILAIGHSARDTFDILINTQLDIKPKPFAVGLRVEHPVELINLSQYGKKSVPKLGNAAYKITHTCKDNRGVYSFCMCPGGYVINASSEEGLLAINGMSYNDRNSDYSNSAVIITVNPEDYGDGIDPKSGIEFQRKLEKKAYEVGDGKIPYEYFSEYKEGKISREDTNPKVKGMYSHGNVHEILPAELSSDFIEAMEAFDKSIKGFGGEETIVMGVESRTSSPVRIYRDELGISSVHNLFPAGEGAGYAGGITSAAMDGILAAENVSNYILG